MSCRTQEPSRLTRSMTSSRIRRSARLQNNHDQRRSSVASSPRSNEVGALRGAKTRRRPLVPLESRKSKSRNECGPVQAKAKPRDRQARSREKSVSGGSSDRTVNPAASCSGKTSKVKDLEEQLETALQAKLELVNQVKENKFNSAKLTLKHLEDYFTCPLCFEIMACPYTLTPRVCGHTFCATCILKWFFSRLHKGCGGWHEAVDCPLCRNSLPHTPERTPRSASSFPFTPNRTADAAIRGLMNAISRELAGAPTVASSSLAEWNENGHNKQEWSKRESTGRNEMASIAAQWSLLRPTDFVNIKNRLEV